MAGVDPQTARQAEVSRGALPPWMLAKPVLDRVQDTVEDIVAAAPQGDARSLDVKVALRDGRLLTGTVPGVVGDVLRTVTYSRDEPARPPHRLGPAARAHRRPPGPQLRGRHRRPALPTTRTSAWRSRGSRRSTPSSRSTTSPS